MDTAIIGQIQKSIQYAKEPERINVIRFAVSFTGHNHEHIITYEGGMWNCDCGNFKKHGLCSHIRAMENHFVAWVKFAKTVKDHVYISSAMITQMKKAFGYAEEPERIRFINLYASFTGKNKTHSFVYDEGQWSCTCHTFEPRGICSHVMAVERILGEWVNPVQPKLMPA